jgi:nitroreductase/NAD-dependent dihydropyrimidine dehydrogenase PreA subunit
MSAFDPHHDVQIGISDESCTQCGRCVTTCPRGLLVIDAGRVRTVDDLAARCILCGHCTAACEPGALRHSALSPEACPPADNVDLNDAQLERFLRHRRSIRRFRSAPVEPALVDRLLDIARYAPTGKNMQGVHYTVLTGRRIRQLEVATAGFYRRLIGRLTRPIGRHLVKLFAGARGLDSLIKGLPDLRRDVQRVDAGEPCYGHGAPVVIMVHGDELFPTMPEDCCFASYHLILAAESLGLGTCLIGYITSAAGREKAIRAAVELPAGHRIYSTVAVGWSAERFVRLIPRNPANVKRLGDQAPIAAETKRAPVPFQ